MRTTLRCLATAATMFLSTASFAAPEAVGRDLRGQAVVVGEGPALVVFWSMDCESCSAELRQLSSAGLSVTLVNTDSAQERSRLPGWLHANGVELPVVADPTGRLQARFAVDQGEGAVMTGARGQVLFSVTELAQLNSRLATVDIAAVASLP